MKKLAVIIYGPPGAGKGTIANLLSWKHDWVHFDSGRFLEAIILDPANARNKMVQRERRLFNKGTLLTPSWVVKMTSLKAATLGRAGLSVVYSGSPRTMHEAFGDAKQHGIISVLRNYYGKKNIYIIYLTVKSSTSIKRNSARRVCTVCATVVNFRSHAKCCPICGGKLRTRTLDTADIIRHRLIEYKNRTLPIVKELKKRKFNVLTINAEPEAYKVFEKVDKILTS